MRVTVIQRAAHNRPCAEAVASGLRRHGHVVTVQDHLRNLEKVVVIWGWGRGKHLRAAGHEVLVMERGYLGDRFNWYSLGWNGLNGFAEFPPYPHYGGGARFGREHGALLRPWRHDGDYVLLLGQVPGDAALRGEDLLPWYSKAALRAHNAYELPVKFRGHPEAIKRGYKFQPGYTEPSEGTLDEALARAFVAITYNSNSAVDAVLAGVPTVAVDQGSMAWPVAAHHIGELRRPDRTDWAARLAWKQWRLEEIARGVPFQVLPRSIQ